MSLYRVPEGAGITVDINYLNEQLTAVCKIQIQGVGKATGFIGHLQQNDRYLLITNHHVLQQHKHDPKKIKIIFKHGELKGSELFANDRWFTDNGTNLQDKTKYGLDYTMIPVIKEKLVKLKITPFDLTVTELKENDTLIVPGHPLIDNEQQDLKLSIHRCKNLVGFFVYYGCTTHKGSSGSPVLKEVDGKLRVVALHRACQKRYLNYGSLFSAVFGHAFGGGDCPETTVHMVKIFLGEVKWKPLETADLLQWLQPVEDSWEELGGFLLKGEMEYKIGTIQSDCFHDDCSNKALIDALKKWRRSSSRAERNWKTLNATAKKYKDDSLEKYILAEGLEDNVEPTIAHLQMWSRDSKLRTHWYNFSVKLIGQNETEIIKTRYFGGGTHSCLQKMLVTWQQSTTDPDWQMIIDALEKMKEFSLIDSIESYCLQW